MRSLKELKELSKLALDHEELMAIVRIASSNTDAKNRALVFVRMHGLEERVAMSCRWLKILRDEVGQEKFDNFVSHQTRKEVSEMTSQTMSKTEDYRFRINALCACPDAKISSRAQATKQLDFDPTRMEAMLDVTFATRKLSELSCAHCVSMVRFYLKLERMGSCDIVGTVSLDPMGKSGCILKVDIWQHSFSIDKEFIVDSIEYNEEQGLVIFHTHTRSYYGEDGSEMRERQKITLANLIVDFRPRSVIIEGADSHPQLMDKLRFEFVPAS